MAWQYSDKVMQLFTDATQGKEGTHLGEITDADGFGEHGSIACGDALRFTFRVKRHPDDPTQDMITEARYLTFGCTSAIASSEALCIMIEQRKCSPIEALQITNDDIVSFLEGLPNAKIHCSVMGAEALEAAVFNWAQKRGVDLELLGINTHHEEQEEGRIVCKCFSLSEPYLRRKISELNLRSIDEITHAVKAGGACMACHHAPGGLQDLLDEIWGDALHEHSETPDVLQPTESTSGLSLSPYQLGKKLDELIETTIRPMLAKDGGDIEIVDIKEEQVYVSLKGACAGCTGAANTLKLLVERQFKEQIDEHLRVIAV